MPEYVSKRPAAKRVLELGARAFAGSQQQLAPFSTPRQRSCAQPRQHPSAQQRGLTDARWAKDSDQGRLHQPREQIR